MELRRLQVLIPIYTQLWSSVNNNFIIIFIQRRGVEGSTRCVHQLSKINITYVTFHGKRIHSALRNVLRKTRLKLDTTSCFYFGFFGRNLDITIISVGRSGHML